jgi:hypothetical protein
MLQERVFHRATARTFFGIGGDGEWLNAYDGLRYELEGPRLEEFRSLVAQSHVRATGLDAPQADSIYGFLGKRLGLGAWGIVAGLGHKMASMLHAEDRVDGQFDEAASVLAELASDGTTLGERERDRSELIAEYKFGSLGGRVVGALVTAGIGASAEAVQDFTKGLKGGKALVDIIQAASRILHRMDEIKLERPDVEWHELLADDELRILMVEAIGAAIDLAEGVGEFSKYVGELLERAEFLTKPSKISIALEKVWLHYNDAKLTEEQRKKCLVEDSAELLEEILDGNDEETSAGK